MAPDGRSIVTAVGLTQRPLFLHTDKGNQEISLDGYAVNPKFSRDGKTVFYQLFKPAAERDGPSELWMADVDGQALFVSVSSTGNTLYGAGRTYVIPLNKGRTLPDIPPGGFHSQADLAGIAGVQVIEAADVGPGPRRDVYAFSRETTQRNLYRIPIR